MLKGKSIGKLTQINLANDQDIINVNHDFYVQIVLPLSMYFNLLEATANTCEDQKIV